MSTTKRGSKSVRLFIFITAILLSLPYSDPANQRLKVTFLQSLVAKIENLLNVFHGNISSTQPAITLPSKGFFVSLTKAVAISQIRTWWTTVRISPVHDNTDFALLRAERISSTGNGLNNLIFNTPLSFLDCVANPRSLWQYQQHCSWQLKQLLHRPACIL